MCAARRSAPSHGSQDVLRTDVREQKTRSLTREHFEHHDWARADIRSENEKG